MCGIECVPVEQACYSGRIKNSGLPNNGTSAVWLNLELKPGTTGDLHLSDQTQATIRLTGQNAPEIQSIARGECVWVSTAPAQSHAANKEIQKTSQPP
jgi:hypothetical protein